MPGITTMAGERRVHLANAGGAYFHLVSNFYLLAQVEYKHMVSSDADSGTLHGQGGVCSGSDRQLDRGGAQGFLRAATKEPAAKLDARA